MGLYDALTRPDTLYSEYFALRISCNFIEFYNKICIIETKFDITRLCMHHMFGDKQKEAR